MNVATINFSRTNVESWFIPIDLLMLICIIVAILLVLIFMFVIIVDSTCHTIPMLLVTNSSLTGLLFGFLVLYMCLFTLRNDLQQLDYEDIMCRARGYIGYAVCSMQNFSYLLQAMYRYAIVVYPTRLFYRSIKFQLLLISLTWIFGLIYPVAFLVSGEIIYNVDNQICQLPLRLSSAVICLVLCAYLIPVSLTMWIYFKLIRYVKEMGKHAIPANTLLRAQRELKMVRRTAILTFFLFTYCFPYAAFIMMSFFTIIPKYHFRIAYVFIDVLFLFVIITLFQFTDPVKISLMKKISGRRATVVATIA